MSDLTKFIGGFGDAFVKSYFAQQELNQQNEQFRSKLQFDQRQFNLAQAFQRKKFEWDQQQDIKNQYLKDVQIEYYKSLTDKNNAPDKTNLYDSIVTMTNSEGLPTQFGISKTEFDPTTGKPKMYELGTDYSELTQRINATKTDKLTETATDHPYVNFETVDAKIREYNDRNSDEKKGTFSAETWRIGANEDLAKVLKDVGISQEDVDKLWELAGVTDQDNAIMKRNKLKNVLSQQTDIPESQKRALYQMIEVRTR